MEKLFDVVAQEEQTFVTAEISAQDLIALEEANEAVGQVDALETVLADAEQTAVAMEEVAALEESMLEDPASVTVATAMLSAVQTRQLAERLGAEASVGLEDISDPVRTLTVSLEEKRNIAKRAYDYVVMMLKKLVNMAKKAFAKIVMTLNGNEGAIKEQIKKFKKLQEKNKSYTISDDDIEDVVNGLNGFVNPDGGIDTDVISRKINTYLGDKGQDDVGEITLNLADEEDADKLVLGVQKINMTTPYKEVASYIKGHKDKFFGGDNLTGEFDVIVVSVGPSYWRCIISGTVNDKPWVKYKKVSLTGVDVKPKGGTFDYSNMIEMLETAKSANKDIKKYTDKAFKTANKALDKANKLASKVDGDSSDSKKLQLEVAKVSGNTAYGRSIDRYKQIRSAIKLASKLRSTIKDSEKDDK